MANLSSVIKASYSTALLVVLYLIWTVDLNLTLFGQIRKILAPDPYALDAPSMYNFHFGYDREIASSTIILLDEVH